MKTQAKNIATKISKRLIAIVSFLMILTSLSAQTAQDSVKNDNAATSVEIEIAPFCRHEFSIWTSEGLSGLNYKPTFGERDLKFGGNLIGLGYTFYFNRMLGIHTGAELAMYNTAYSLKNLKDAYKTTDLDDLTPGRQGEPIDYHTDLKRYEEKQRLYSVNIPLMLQFQTPLASGVHNYYASLGAKLFVPVKGSYKANGTLDTWGYYYDPTNGSQQILASDNDKNFHLEDLGYYDDLEYSADKKDVKFKIGGLATFETGVKWSLSPKLSLYTGAYIDYGFTNIAKGGGNNFFSFNPEREEIESNSILASQYAHNYGETTKFVDKVSPLSFGVKLRLGVNMCKMAKIDKKEEKKSEKKPEKKEDGETQKAEELFDAYRKGFLDAINNKDGDNGGDKGGKKGKNQPHNLQEEEDYQSDPRWNMEMERATAEYGELKDLLIMYVDGYELNQAYLSPIMKKMLDDRLRVLNKYNNDNYIIIAEGHTCDLGREEFNMALGQKRAEVVRDYMISKDYNGDNIIPVSKGESTPIVGNSSEANRKINRRVVFLIKERR
ncbi:MAG: OmpA family protein [Prevotellaceae bacterium]|jgi:outer membrane protein OmpA-like peptidoglycan-associated protein|nr:OmpA family protein [Prevotellaceae bacterium]